MMKSVLALSSLVFVTAIVAGWSLAAPAQSLLPSAAAQAPTPSVSVTTLPALPGLPSSGPSSTPTPLPVPVLTPFPTTPPMPTVGPTSPPVGVAYIPVVGQVLNLFNLTPTQLRQMRPSSLTLHFHTYTGVPLIDIIKLARPSFLDDPATLMRKYVYVQGFNGQNAILSFPEFSDQFNGQLVLLAYMVDLRDVKPPGFAQLVVQGDRTQTRFIKVARLIIGEPPH
ncbi:MAG: hypothetical protein M3Z41_04860 [Candidatus Eremiobacteraeota bacterium]|nr:hypothetical protein [Candidatus Eremiobacteraeota bacterium]